MIRDLQSSLRHRGPDDQGLYTSQDRVALLAHTRLSIIDTGSTGHQPMSLAGGRYWITFNGEIYNYRELRRTLDATSEPFHSESDTEVLLRLYQRDGPRCVKHLRGMFAFAIWDDQEKTCFLARDPLGIKPLYYWHQGPQLVFASEVRSILRTGLTSRRLSPQGLLGYLANGSVPEPCTIVDDIGCLPAGHTMTWTQGVLSPPLPYWQVTFAGHASPVDARERVREALLDSLRHHFVSDVPVSVFLSGGIDSSALVALSRQVHSGRLRTYSIAFQEKEFNEGAVARAVSETFETHHEELLVTASSAHDVFAGFLETMDQPSVDGFNSYCISKFASQQGCKVVLSGLGGDELFGGYPSFQRIPRMVAWSRILHRFNVLGPALFRWLEPLVQTDKQRRLFEFLRGEPGTRAAYQAYRGIFSLSRARHIASDYHVGTLPAAPYVALPFLEDLASGDDVGLLETTCYMRNQLLRDSDVNSMASGLELRVPFVDQVLVDTVNALPSRQRLAPGKHLLVSSIPELPSWLIHRPKKGFSFPFALWFDSEWKEAFGRGDMSHDIKPDYWYQRWIIGALDHWVGRHLNGAT